jgi:hypothetical protein
VPAQDASGDLDLLGRSFPSTRGNPPQSAGAWALSVFSASLVHTGSVSSTFSLMLATGWASEGSSFRLSLDCHLEG